jgi:ribonuclease HI
VRNYVESFVAVNDVVSYKIECSDMTNRIKLAAYRLNKSGAAGPDKLFPRALTTVIDSIILHLSRIFELCIARGYFPSVWKRGKLMVIPKSDRDPSTLKGLRPLTLLSCLSKLFELILSFEINNHISACGLFSDNMHGFVNGRSCDSLLYSLTNFVDLEVAKGNVVVLLQFDISKAFDALWHPALLHSMINFNFPSWIITLISSYLSGRSVTCDYGGNSFSSLAPLGVPQGSILGPVLWNLYNCLLHVELDKYMLNNPLTASWLLLSYADDNTIIVSAKNQSQALELAESLSGVVLRWCKFAKLSLSADKTCCLFFSHARAPNPRPLVIDGKQVAFSRFAKVLGVAIDRTLSWHKHVDDRCNAVRALLIRITCILRNNYGIRSCDLLKLFPIVISSRLFHGIVGWCTALNYKTIYSKMLQLQHSFCRFVIKAFRTTSGVLAQCIAGLPSIIDMAKCAVITRFLHGFFPHPSSLILNRENLRNPGCLVASLLDDINLPIDAVYEKKVPSYVGSSSISLAISDRDVAVRDYCCGGIQVFSDGSKLSCGSAGCGFLILFEDRIIMEKSVRLRNFAHSHECELYGLFLAAENLSTLDLFNSNRSAPVTFYCDSKAALYACSDFSPSNPIARNFQLTVRSFENVSLKWAPARSGLIFQERSDYLARYSHNCSQPHDGTLFLKHYTKLCCSSFQSRNLLALQGRISVLVGSTPAAFFPNSHAFRPINAVVSKNTLHPSVSSLLTGHNALGKYLFCIGAKPDPTCSCGAAVESTEHFILYCPLYDNLRSELSASFNVVFPSSLMSFTRSSRMLDLLRAFTLLSGRFDILTGVPAIAST